MKQRIVHDVSALPTWGFETKSTPWWGTLGFIAIEGAGFALAIGMFLYLEVVGGKSQLGPPPSTLWPATSLALVLLASLAPNWWANRVALRQDLGLARIAVVMMSAIGLVTLALRGFEIAYLNVPWNLTAYGSTIWFIIGLHTTHLATDVGDTIVLAVLMFTRHAQPRRFSDITDNAFYWYFVVASWILLYGLVYWLPRGGA